MRKFLCLSFTAIFIFLLTAAPQTAHALSEIKIFFDGSEVELPYGINPVGGVATAALCDITSMLGARCTYEPVGKTATLRFSRHMLRMTVGSTRAYDEDGEITLKSTVFSKDGVIYVPIEDVVKALRIGYFTDADTETVYMTLGALENYMPDNIKVPVLMYHAVSDDIWGIKDLFVSPKELEKQLNYLNKNGYTAITFEDMSRVDEIDKPIILTFDDGYRDNYTNLFPLLKKYKIKATIFVITDAIGNDLYLTQDMITEMTESGLVSIQSHTQNHFELDKLSESEIREQFEKSQLAILRLTKKQPIALCYPLGKYSNTTLSVIGDYYAYGARMAGGIYNTSTDRYLINRLYVKRSMDLNDFSNKIA